MVRALFCSDHDMGRSYRKVELGVYMARVAAMRRLPQNQAIAIQAR
jgi:hypothetical protein